MSRSRYQELRKNIGLGEQDLATMSAQFSFNALDGIRSGSARKLVVEVVERTSARQQELLESEKVAITHAAKGTEWRKVKQDLRSMETDLPANEILENANYKVNK